MNNMKNRKYIAIVLTVVLCMNYISCCGLNVNASEYAAPIVEVSELDIGDYQSQMAVGEKQLLSVTVLPMDATDQTLKFSSSDVSVAKINGM